MICLRLYAVTGRNKLYGAVFITLITGQFGGGLWYDIVSGRAPSELFIDLLIFAQSHWLSVQKLPPINLDAFRACAAASVRSGAISFVSIAIAFGASPNSHLNPGSSEFCFHLASRRYL